MKILVVDDDKNTLKTVALILETRLRAQIDTALNGKQALQKIKDNGDYSLIILDLMMPEISGLDVCRKISKDKKFKKIPVMILSALPVYSKIFQKSQNEFSQMDIVKGMVEKPFDIDSLVDSVKKIIGFNK